MWYLFARHTTMTLIILYLVYTQVSTVVSDEVRPKALALPLHVFNTSRFYLDASRHALLLISTLALSRGERD